jgi:type VI secretion system secreted protein Hcp
MAMSIFARIGTIKGESRDARHTDEIDVLAWSWGVSHPAAAAGPGAGGGAGAGKASFRDLVFTHAVDRASPLLMRACATGERISDATITVRGAGDRPQDHLVVTMTDVVVTSVATSVGAGGDTGTEEVALSFAKVDLEYRPQRPDGALDDGIHFVYDVRAQRAG